MSQFDVTTAFLHGDLDEEIFMEQPLGFNDNSGSVCFLKKGLYGLKQAPRAWNNKFHEFLSSYGLERSYADPCVYVSDKEGYIILGIYVDDGLLCCSSKTTKDKMINEMNKKFEIKVGMPNCFVGLQVQRNREEVSLFINKDT